MILAKVHTTPLQRIEFRLLMAIRFACLMAVAKGHINPMDCPRVKARTAALEQHLSHYRPSLVFVQSYQNKAGELGQCLALRYNAASKRIMIWRNTPFELASKVTPLRGRV
ncbi:hypothetical protein Sden_3272 [Shewanella denitrificans OS217]|uniref:Uncharacterized protein n=1 Tax=Shewanella denitrificans (strain OS217 / ATCC BAA-1090 / DSM 15013) TaxID=318161 RepID=Q12J28_SHEDO|nr:hypothetical protein [Shewanella denitrificans]ABE56548.1 hypothetical protein Sden_3272 [Shewanella denitrificans OS217]